MKINSITVMALFLCVTLQGMQNKDQDTKELLKIDELSILSNYDINTMQWPNSCNRKGETALTLAAGRGDDVTVTKLLKKGASPLSLGYKITSPELGYYKGPIEPFLKYHASLALNLASKNGHKKCMKLLIKYGAKPFKINGYYTIPKNSRDLSWSDDDKNKAPINDVVEKSHTDCVKMLFEYAIQQDKQLDEKVLLADYIDAVSQVTSYKKYVGEKSYKEYLQKNITFLLLVNKFSPHKSVHYPASLLPKKLFLEKIVRLSLYNTYPMLSEGLKVGSPSLSRFSPQEITHLFNYYKQNYEHCFPENSFIKYVEPKFFDKVKTNCICF